MDIFQVLTRGASVRKAGRSGGSADFSKTPVDQDRVVRAGSTKKPDSERQLTKELDFFRNKRIVHKIEADGEQDTNDEDSVKRREVSDARLKFEVGSTKISTAEDAAELRKTYMGKVSGDDVPLPIGSFEDLVARYKFDKRLISNLLDAHFTEPTPIQCEGIPIALDGRDILACAPTGSGKTLSFVLPLLQQVIASRKTEGLKGLIISPTKELANQIFLESTKLSNKIFMDKKRPLSVALLSKSLSAKLKNKIVSDKKYDIIISTPLRLIDVVKQGALDLSSVKHIIFDEADKLFDQTFVEQADSILASCRDPQLRKSMVSATMPSGLEQIAHTIMLDPVRIIIGHKEAANSSIEQKLVFCGNEEGKLVAIRQMIQEGGFKPPVIIFLESITRAKALFHELLYDNLNVDVIHAERTQIQRDKIIQRFRTGEIWCLICTDVLARGVDFKGVNLVINYDVPRTAQAYVHRIGRTGRNGRDGTAVTFYTKQDNLAVKPIINVMKQSGSEVAEWMDDFSKMTKREKEALKKGKSSADRQQISTVPKLVKQKRRQREEMVEASKRRKAVEEVHSENDV